MFEEQLEKWSSETLDKVNNRIATEQGIDCDLRSLVLEQCQKASEGIKESGTITMIAQWVGIALFLSYVVLFNYGFKGIITCFVTVIIMQAILFFSIFASSFFRKKARETSIQSASRGVTMLFSLRAYLFINNLLSQIITQIVGRVISFWVINRLLAFFGLVYLGLLPAIYFGVAIGSITVILQYLNGRKIYCALKDAVVKNYSVLN